MPSFDQVLDFMNIYPGYTFNLVVAHILFWIFGMAFGVIPYGYNNDLYQSDDGALLSGPSGSGVFPISLFLVLLSSSQWYLRMLGHIKEKAAAEESH